MIDFFVDAFWYIVHYELHRPAWQISQVFAFFALITMFWSFQIKNKLKMMLLLGLGTTFLAVSAAFLANWTLTVLFVVASVRNYVFCYFEWRALKERPVARWLWLFFGGVFIAVTVGSTVTLVHVVQVETAGVWVEWLICATLIGLIVGNVITGTNLMRVSFVANRAFNIINHAYFNNVIAVIIACLTISSNIIFYIRQFVAWKKEQRIKLSDDPLLAQSQIIITGNGRRHTALIRYWAIITAVIIAVVTVCVAGMNILGYSSGFEGVTLRTQAWYVFTSLMVMAIITGLAVGGLLQMHVTASEVLVSDKLVIGKGTPLAFPTAVIFRLSLHALKLTRFALTFDQISSVDTLNDNRLIIHTQNAQYKIYTKNAEKIKDAILKFKCD